jgi:hypothetical protein
VIIPSKGRLLDDVPGEEEHPLMLQPKTNKTADIVIKNS